MTLREVRSTSKIPIGFGVRLPSAAIPRSRPINSPRCSAVTCDCGVNCTPALPPQRSVLRTMHSDSGGVGALDNSRLPFASYSDVKKCGYCGRENASDVASCAECGTSLVPEVRKQPEGAEALKILLLRPLPRPVRIMMLLAPWVLVVLGTLAKNPQQLLTAPFFPAGLIAVLKDGPKLAVGAWMITGGTFGLVGWLVYIFLMAGAATRKPPMSVIFYILFLILLVLNVRGCERLLEAVKGIE